jgi:hypothetical protein
MSQDAIVVAESKDIAGPNIPPVDQATEVHL